jgi:hypothetical protein
MLCEAGAYSISLFEGGSNTPPLLAEELNRPRGSPAQAGSWVLDPPSNKTRTGRIVMYMLDTSICIYIIKKKTDKILDTLKQKRKSGLSISSITLAELEYANENSIELFRNLSF